MYQRIGVAGRRLSSFRRTLASKAGTNPLSVLQQECLARRLCDKDGNRNPNTHWVCSIAVQMADSAEKLKPPNLRTVGIERVSLHGIDFVLKRGIKTANRVAAGEAAPVAILHRQGHYLPGETVEQWRGDGICHEIDLSEVLVHIPHWVITGMVGSVRLANERETGTTRASPAGAAADDKRAAMLNKSHFTEIMQKTRLQLENDEIPMDEMVESMQAMRFRPNRMEHMQGGPDALFWDRWEWKCDPSSADSTNADDEIKWLEPQQLVPH